MPRLSLRRTDPFWDLDGQGVRRERTRRRVVGSLAFFLAVGACGLTAATWIRLLEPGVTRLLGS
ncbi:MAG TPA: hypothetical protein VLA23_06090 [Candidatus Limnocylindrales bacterium]|nr:hypothetical protein [Candidatus Limnocylindrales bacterium]